MAQNVFISSLLSFLFFPFGDCLILSGVSPAAEAFSAQPVLANEPDCVLRVATTDVDEDVAGARLERCEQLEQPLGAPRVERLRQCLAKL